MSDEPPARKRGYWWLAFVVAISVMLVVALAGLWAYDVYLHKPGTDKPGIALPTQYDEQVPLLPIVAEPLEVIPIIDGPDWGYSFRANCTRAGKYENFRVVIEIDTRESRGEKLLGRPISDAERINLRMKLSSDTNMPDGECAGAGPKPHATGFSSALGAMAPGTVVTFTVRLDTIEPGADGVVSTSRAQRAYIFREDRKLYEK
ncbi:MAG TPA: hypothetical protein VGE45_18180 [Chloroflexia bacterium]|jgi:hypothetical protein